MEIDNLGGGHSTEGVIASTDATESSPESNTSAAQDPLKNLKAEMNRKLSKINDSFSKDLQEIKTLLAGNRQTTSVEETEPTDVKEYVETRFVRKEQENAWSQALEMFPELNKDSDNFDEKFFQTADQYFASFDLKKDPQAPLKAVKLAALDLGKVEQLTKEKLLRDEARRSRIIAEGASTPRDAKKEREPQINTRGLAKLGIDPEKLKKRVKSYKERAGE